MKSALVGWVIAVAVGLTATPAGALPITFTGTNGSNLSASVMFDVSGTNLLVTLTNTSLVDVDDPPDILTAVFFDITGNPVLAPSSAALGGSTVFFGPNGGGNVGGEWAYSTGLVGAPGGASQGISSSGFGLFGAANFGGPDLDPPAAVNGLNYGLTSAGDNLATGNAAVTGTFPLIQNSVAFTLGGLPGGFSLSSISNITFQYGTSLTEPSFPGDGDHHLVPEPGSLLLLGSGLGALGIWRRKRAKGGHD